MRFALLFLSILIGPSLAFAQAPSGEEDGEGALLGDQGFDEDETEITEEEESDFRTRGIGDSPSDGGPATGTANPSSTADENRDGPSTTTTGGAGATDDTRSGTETTDPAGSGPAEGEEEDDDRSNVFYLQAGAGVSYIDAVTISQDNFVPEADRQSGTGFAVEAATGFNILFLNLGARVTFATYEPFDLGTVGIDLGARIRTEVVEPFIRVGLGYAWLGRANYSSPADSDVSVFGLTVDAGVGVDFFFADFFAAGITIDGAFLSLSRQSIDEGCAPCELGTINFEEDGDAAGLALRALAHVRLEL